MVLTLHCDQINHRDVCQGKRYCAAWRRSGDFNWLALAGLQVCFGCLFDVEGLRLKLQGLGAILTALHYLLLSSDRAKHRYLEERKQEIDF